MKAWIMQSALLCQHIPNTVLFPDGPHDDAVLFCASQLQTFNTPAPCRTVEELTTGAAISQALHQM